MSLGVSSNLVPDSQHDKKKPSDRVSMLVDDEDAEVKVDSKQKESPEFKAAMELEAKAPEQAIARYKQLIAAADADGSQQKTKEDSIYRLGELYAKLGRAKDLQQLVVDIRPFFQAIAKSKTAKIVRSLIDLVGRIPGTEQLQIDLCLNAIEWCTQEKRTFLRQRIQARLTSIYLTTAKFKEALALITPTLKEVKKVDDKLLLVEIFLIESRVHHSLQNIPKAKAALTSARSSANAIYCPPGLQAEIDLQAGILSAEEKDYKTAFSYFYEAFEGNNTIQETALAGRCLKYMLLTKIMLNHPEDVYTIINGKGGIKYAGIDVEAMRAVADVYKKRDIHSLEAVLKQYHKQLSADSIVLAHLSDLKDALLEQNLVRLIEPFSRVQIKHVATLIAMAPGLVETKLSEMILDKKLNGILDQGSGDLIVFDETQSDKTYSAAVDTVKELSHVVDRLYGKAKRLHSFK